MNHRRRARRRHDNDQKWAARDWHVAVDKKWKIVWTKDMRYKWYCEWTRAAYASAFYEGEDN